MGRTTAWSGATACSEDRARQCALPWSVRQDPGSPRNAALLDSTNASHTLIITLEVGQYWPRQGGLRGSKSVELGAGHTVPLPWLTSLETPVSVLQLTGALVNRDGKAVRIGAEGLVAQRTPLVASGLGAQRLISDEDVERALSVRHSNRPGQPLVWRAATCQLLNELAGKRCGQV